MTLAACSKQGAVADKNQLFMWLSEAGAVYGVTVNSVRPSIIPGHGSGMIATEALEPNDLVLHVPFSAMRTVDNTPKSIVNKLRAASVHCILAVSLILDHSAIVTTWKKSMPTPTEMFSSMPIAWPPDAQACLPTNAARKLSHQKIKFSRDWASVKAAFPDITHLEFLHSWLLVNTRSFYHATPATKLRAIKDQMILQPVADLFNHEPNHGCRIRVDGNGFFAFADRSYRRGEEVPFCYGRHSNDTLLVEYGFTIASNTWDNIILDNIIMPRLDSVQQAWLDEYDFLGDYHMDAQGVCHRTEVAMRAILLPHPRWTMFAQGEDDGEDSEGIVNDLLQSILSTYIDQMNVVISVLMGLGLDENHHLLQRWSQVATMTRTVRLKLMAGPEDTTGMTGPARR